MNRISLFATIFIILLAPLAHADKNVLVVFEVKDPSGAAIPGAEVSISDRASGASSANGLRTNTHGVVSQRLKPGTYHVSVEISGFKKLNKSVNVTDEDNQTVAIELQIGSCSPCVEVGPAVPSISLSIKPVTQPIKSGSKIRISITLTNISQQQIVVYTDKSGKGELSGYRLFLYDNSGNEGKKTDYQRLLKGEPTAAGIMVLRTSAVPEPIQPGKSIVDSIDLSSLYDLDSPGTYLIYVEREDPVTKLLVRSDTQKIRVIQ